MSRSHPVALVTGGCGALGTAIALRLARSGARIAVNDIDAAKAVELAGRLSLQTGQRCVPAVADVTDQSAVEQMVARICEELGAVDTLVNNAGILRNHSLLSMDEDAWDSVIDTHLKGAFLCCRAVVPAMREQGFGRIVNISSGAVRGSGRGHANYSSAKAGLIGLTRTLAVELGPEGITVNAVAPGAIRSEMTRTTARQLNENFETYEQQMAAVIPVRRLGEPEDVSNAVAFFAMRTSGFVNGQVLYVSGGP